MKRIGPAVIGIILLINCAIFAQTQPSVWQVVDGDWEGAATAPIWKLVVWPGKDLLIASTRSNGLWSSSDGGASWKRMGEKGKTPPNAGQAVTFVFDPKDDQTMWTAGMYGYGVWKTSDGGKTFTQLIPDKTHVDGISVDFSDPERKTLLVGLHEQEQSIHRSTDGGKTWEKIGDKVPAGTAFTSDPIILDSKTYITPSAGYKKDEKWGIYRSEDAGETWTSVSKEGASGNCLITSKGEILWPRLWDQAIVRSSDQGKTWSRLSGPARGIPVELKNGWLVGLGGKDRTQLYVSKDDGATWTALGPPVPFKTHGFVYDAARKTFFVWAEHDNDKPKNSGELVRWELSVDVEKTFETPMNADEHR